MGEKAVDKLFKGYWGALMPQFPRVTSLPVCVCNPLFCWNPCLSSHKLSSTFYSALWLVVKFWSSIWFWIFLKLPLHFFLKKKKSMDRGKKEKPSSRAFGFYISYVNLKIYFFSLYIFLYKSLPKKNISL